MTETDGLEEHVPTMEISKKDYQAKQRALEMAREFINSQYREWDEYIVGLGVICSYCGNLEREGHVPNCLRQAALAAIEKALK